MISAGGVNSVKGIRLGRGKEGGTCIIAFGAQKNMITSCMQLGYMYM